ncbi:lycopene cyclase domain-containing protein [Demequina sp. NBRC 110052]|uniref:lycopene cyclase domain-containing protein n=1 Tax=Demequina sp. NBRC 110052 TaxID=1570341 RepID=UPI0009FC4AA9|nr:lycopene cyclase domain-containing protein [Demequina sp. NBRC 110052]
MTYVILSVAVLALLALVTVPTLRRLRARPLLLTGLVLVALTAVFDNVIVGLGIVDYDEALISGVRVWFAPIEDFSYALGAVLLVPALWTWLGRSGRTVTSEENA